MNGAENVIYRKASSVPLNQGEYAQMTVGCQPGERLIGGGAGWPFASVGDYDRYEQLGTSGPGILLNPTTHRARPIAEGETPDVWYASGYQGEVNQHTLTVFAICATP